MSYPATFTYDGPERVANWRPLVQWLLMIPHLIVVEVLQAVAGVLALVSWFIILFTGRMPEGIAGFQVMALRYQIRTTVALFAMTEEYPPFEFQASAADPGVYPHARYDALPQLEGRNRLSVGLRFIYVIPHLIVLSVLWLAFFVVAIVAWFAVLFTGRWPVGIKRFCLGVLHWTMRVNAYWYLIIDDYPPFSLEPDPPGPTAVATVAPA
jgi:hypothetical protein